MRWRRHFHPVLLAAVTERQTALLRSMLMLAAVFGVALTSSPGRAQQDSEHEAIARAIRMQTPSDPGWQAMKRVAARIMPHQGTTLIRDDPATLRRRAQVPANARMFFQQITLVVPPAYVPFVGVMLLSFDQATEARSYTASNPTSPPYDLTPGSEYRIWDLLAVNPSCRRIVGGRHVIEIRGIFGCYQFSRRKSSFDAVFNVLVTQANQALSSLPLPTADQPPVSAAQPPGSAGPLADTQLPETNAELPPGPGDLPIDDLANEIPELTPAEIAPQSALRAARRCWVRC